jgi:hypothetical protein
LAGAAENCLQLSSESSRARPPRPQDKTLRVRRLYDPDRRNLLYVAYSTRLSGASDDKGVSAGRYRRVALVRVSVFSLKSLGLDKSFLRGGTEAPVGLVWVLLFYNFGTFFGPWKLCGRARGAVWSARRAAWRAACWAAWRAGMATPTRKKAAPAAKPDQIHETARNDTTPSPPNPRTSICSVHLPEAPPVAAAAQLQAAAVSAE